MVDWKSRKTAGRTGGSLVESDDERFEGESKREVTGRTVFRPADVLLDFPTGGIIRVASAKGKGKGRCREDICKLVWRCRNETSSPSRSFRHPLLRRGIDVRVGSLNVRASPLPAATAWRSPPVVKLAHNPNPFFALLGSRRVWVEQVAHDRTLLPHCRQDASLSFGWRLDGRGRRFRLVERLTCVKGGRDRVG
jgi:hypothetical protein